MVMSPELYCSSITALRAINETIPSDIIMYRRYQFLVACYDMLGKGTQWFSRFEHTPRALSWLIGRFVHDIDSQLIHHDHIAICQLLVGYISIERALHLGQLSLDLRGLVSVTLACYMHFLYKLILWQGENGVQRMHQVHAAIEHDESSMCQASRQAKFSPTLQRLVILPCEIGKGQHIQLPLQECHHVGIVSFLPDPQEFQAVLSFIALDILINTE